jgi:hypothetical protein
LAEATSRVEPDVCAVNLIAFEDAPAAPENRVQPAEHLNIQPLRHAPSITNDADAIQPLGVTPVVAPIRDERDVGYRGAQRPVKRHLPAQTSNFVPLSQ